MTVDQMREVIEKQYPNDTWRRKVKNMSDAQVMALFYRFEELNNYINPEKG